MTNLELYINAFVEGLGIDEEQVEGLAFQGVPEWDSVGHMTLVSAIEDAFDIVLILMISLPLILSRRVRKY